MNEFDMVMEHFGFKDHETIEAFRQHLELKSYKKGDIVFEVGDVVPYIYIMVGGIARSYTLTKDGERITNKLFRVQIMRHQRGSAVRFCFADLRRF